VTERTRSVLGGAFHPVAFAIAYVLNVWVGTALSIFTIGRAVIVAPLAALALVAVGWLLFRDVRRAGIMATAVIAFTVFGRDVALLIGNTIQALPGWQTEVLLILIGALVISGLIVGRHRGLRIPDIDTATRALNALAAALLIVIVGTAVLQGGIGQTIQDLNQGVDLAHAPARPANSGLPDIYVIFLDGYPRADVLASRYGFDNSPFLDALRDRGLEVSPASHSNYTLTQFALQSMFNVDLLQDIPRLQPVLAGDVPAQPVSRRLLNDNPVLNRLHQLGYVTVGLSGTYEDVALRRADIFLETGHMNEVEWRLVSRTFLVDMADALMPNFFRDQQREFIDASFDQALRVARDHAIGPRFVLAHVFAPHAPLVYGAEGDPVDLRELRRTEDTAQAAGLSIAEFGVRLKAELTYLNGRTIDLIDTIQVESATPPVIIVMSDHGSRSLNLDPAHPDPELVRERFGTLFAASTPGHAGIYPPDTTPAEILGRLLHAYFGDPYEPPGHGIFAASSDHYAFVRLGDAPPTPQPSP
jgi:hypothetical protein